MADQDKARERFLIKIGQVKPAEKAKPEPKTTAKKDEE
jgi:hypothetical protein